MNKKIYQKSDLKCICIKDYIFNKTDNFSGVKFEKDSIYEFHKPDIRYPHTNLVSVFNHNTNSHVGMSIKNFNKYFIVNLDYYDDENKNICYKYGIKYRTGNM